MKIVINRTYGAFQLSDEMMEYVGYKKICESDCGWDFSRTDPKLIEFLEKFPDKSGSLKVVEIPDDVEWEIEEDYGKEWIAEVHRTWD